MPLQCLRCKNNEAIFMCVTCESFKQLCTQCDSYVHGLPSKKKHKRNVIVVESKSNTKGVLPLEEEDKIWRKNQKYTKEGQGLTGNNFNESAESKYRDNLNTNFISNHSQSIDKSITNPINYNNDEKVSIRSITASRNNVSSQSIPVLQQPDFNLDLPNYSKEYLNEMKVSLK